ncbi:phage antirepressor KilAC domain-containing protein [Lachnospiraceae bacterium LCP25S3_G4]
MNELIKVNLETQTVSARDLHDALEVKERFSVWFGRFSDLFESGTDFTTVGKPTLVNNGATRELEDYSISVDMAKHISMMCKTEKGKQCRQYFIDLEKAWNTPEQIFARALKMADVKIHSLETDVERMKPKEIFADAVSTSHTSILVGDLAKLLKQNGVEIGARRLFDWLRDKQYLIRRKGTDWNMPTQKSMEMGLFEIKESTHIDGNGCNITSRTPKVTGKGQLYFINKFLAEQ